MIMIRDVTTLPTVAELAQSVERTTLNRVVVGSIPTFGALMFCVIFFVSSVKNYKLARR